MEEIRSWWEVPSISHFCSVFRAAFNLLHFDIEDLEVSLLLDGSLLLEELIVRLLQGCLRRTDITEQNWEEHLREFLEEHWVKERGHSNPLPYAGSKFSYLPLRTKVEILHSLCEYRLDADDVYDMIKGLEADGLRVQPIGKDGDGNSYWYFYGTRLYLEEPSLAHTQNMHSPTERTKIDDKKMKHNKKKNKEDSVLNNGRTKGVLKSRWSLVCSSEEDWHALTKKFRKSKITCERKLYAVLENEYLPEIKNMFSSKERNAKKKHLEIPPRRSSLRIGKIQSKKQEEERLAALAEEKRKQEEERRRIQEEQERRNQECLERARRAEERRRAVEEQQRTLRFREECFQLDAPEDKSHFEDVEMSEQHSNANSCAYSDDGEADLEELNQRIRKVLAAVNGHKDSWPFLQPVDEAYAPGYFEWIKEPMDLSTMDQKIENKEYHTTDEFVRDFKKMVNNCEIYNGPNHAFTKIAYILWRIFRKAVRRHLFHDVGNDEDVFVHQQSAANVPEAASICSSENQKARRTTNGMKKKKKKKKKKRPPGMKAIEALAQAAEQALRDAASMSSFDSSPPASFHDESYSNSAFPNLKISTTQSHPASLLAKYFGIGRTETAQGEDTTVSSTTSTPEKLHSIGAVSNFSPKSNIAEPLGNSEADAIHHAAKSIHNDGIKCDVDKKADARYRVSTFTLNTSLLEESVDRTSDGDSNQSFSSSQSDSSDSSGSSDDSCHAHYTIIPINNGNGKFGSFQIKKIPFPKRTEKESNSPKDSANQRLSPDSVLSPTSCLNHNDSERNANVPSNSCHSSHVPSAPRSYSKQASGRRVYFEDENPNSLARNAQVPLPSPPKESPSFQDCLQQQNLQSNAELSSKSCADNSLPVTDVWSAKEDCNLSSEVRQEYSYHRSSESTIPVKKRAYLPDLYTSLPSKSSTVHCSSLQNISPPVTPTLDPSITNGATREHALDEMPPVLSANSDPPLVNNSPPSLANCEYDDISSPESPGIREDADNTTSLSGVSETSVAGFDERRNFEHNRSVYDFDPFEEPAAPSLGFANFYKGYRDSLYQSYFGKNSMFAHSVNFHNNSHLHKEHYYASKVASLALNSRDSKEKSQSFDSAGSLGEHMQVLSSTSNKTTNPYPPAKRRAEDYENPSNYLAHYGPASYIPGTESHLSDFVSHILTKNFPNEQLSAQLSASSQESASVSPNYKPYWKTKVSENSSNLSLPRRAHSNVQQSSPHINGTYYSVPFFNQTSSSTTSFSHQPSFSASSHSASQFQLHISSRPPKDAKETVRQCEPT